MMNENNIDNYFDRVKQNPPLIPIEKVHQIITSPTAKARLKGNNRNLLKFTMMTTIFAVIISAVLFWPGESIESSIKTQDTRQVSDTGYLRQTRNAIPEGFGNSNKDAEKGSKGDENKTIAIADLNKTTSDTETSNALVANNEQIVANNKDNNAVPAKQNNNKPIDFDQETIQPIDGKQFILKLSNEELKEIGFEITDTSIVYENNIGGDWYYWDFKVRKGLNGYFGSSEANLLRSANRFYPSKKRNNFRLSCKTNTFYSELINVDKFSDEEFHLVNDSLLPVIVPISSIHSEKMDILFWFTASNELMDLLSEKHTAVIAEFRKFKQAKIVQGNIDLIRYQPPKMIDDSKILVLTQNELMKLGFSFFPDSTKYSGENPHVKTALVKCKKSLWNQNTNSTDQTSIGNDGCLSVLVTRKDGSPYSTFGKLLQSLFPNTNEYGSQFPLLIPVLVKSSESLFEEDVIFWFYPSQSFFNALPERISNDLRKEYNYVVAEDKSNIEKPECVYFEECKNTLKISSFKVYPNPANSQATVSFTLPEAIDGRITLIDLMGRERQVLQPNTNYSKGAHRFEVDLSNVPEGIYLIALYSSKGIQTQRLIVAR